MSWPGMASPPMSDSEERWDSEVIDGALARLKKELGPGNRPEIVLAPPKGQKIKLPPTDLTMVRRSFTTSDASDDKLMRHMASNAIAPHICSLEGSVLQPHRHLYKTLLPDSINRSPDRGKHEMRIAYMALKIRTTGLLEHEIEIRVFEGFARVAEKMYNDSADFFDTLPRQLSRFEKFLFCSRMILTVCDDLDLPYRHYKTVNSTFCTKLISHPVSCPIAGSNLPAKVEANLVMPPAVASSTRIERVALPDDPFANEPHVHNGPSTWAISEQYLILEGYKHLMEELDEDEEHIDFGELSIFIPGRTKNDCIEYFNSNLAAFGREGEDPEPFGESTAPGLGTRLFKRNAEDGEEELATAGEGEG